MSLLTWQLFAIGGALAAVPILIHLLSRRKVRRVRWAAMDWLLAAMKRHQRRLRLENWLILLLRVAAILLLGLALARPILSDGIGLVSQKRSVYLVLDTSYSTQAKLDARAVIDRVKHEADLVLKSVGPDDATALLVTNDPDEDATSGLEPHVLMGRSVGDEGAARARELVAAMRPRDARADWVKTLQQLQAQFTEEDTNRQVVVVTDLQAKDWLRSPRDVIGDAAGAAATDDAGGDRLAKLLVEILRRPASVRIIDVGGRDRRDLAVLSVRNSGGQDPFVGRPLRMAVEVANFGAEPVSGAHVEVRVDDGDRKRSFPVPDLAAADSGLRIPRPAVELVEIDLPRTTFTAPGSHTLHVTVVPPRLDPGADTLALSSERVVALEVRRRVRVLAWSATSRSEQDMEASLYLRGIYEGDTLPGDDAASDGPPPIYRYEAATSESMLLGRLRDRGRNPVDLLVLANVEPRDANLAAVLRDYVREGGGLLLFTGDQCRAEALNEAFFTQEPETRLLPFAFGPTEVRGRADEDAGHYSFDFRFQERPHPLGEPFTNVKADDWIKRVPPKIWGRMAFRETAPSASPEGGSDAAGAPADGAGIVLRFAPQPGETAGSPAIVSKRFGEGRAVFVATSIDNGWLDRSVLFLPVFLEEAALYLTRPADAGRNLEVGGILRAAIPADAETVRIVPPGGGSVSPRRLTEEGETTGRVEYEHDVLGRTGVWHLTYDVPSLSGEPEKRSEAFAVNPDPYEGLLLAASHDALAAAIPVELDFGFLPSYGAVGDDIQEAREGEITRFLLYLLLGVLLLESFLALRFGRRSGMQAGGEA